MFELSANLEGEKQLDRRMKMIKTSLKSLFPVMKKTGAYLRDFIKGDVFETRGGAIGERWKPRKSGGSWPLLQKTGKMRRSFKYTPKPLQVRIFNTTDYFKFHQSRMPRRRLPRRVMMKIDKERRNHILQLFHKEINKLLKKKR